MDERKVNNERQLLRRETIPHESSTWVGTHEQRPVPYAISLLIHLQKSRCYARREVLILRSMPTNQQIRCPIPFLVDIADMSPPLRQSRPVNARLWYNLYRAIIHRLTHRTVYAPIHRKTHRKESHPSTSPPSPPSRTTHCRTNQTKPIRNQTPLYANLSSPSSRQFLTPDYQVSSK
jgi:hypothetical protein